jgi:hypothetical protein
MNTRGLLPWGYESWEVPTRGHALVGHYPGARRESVAFIASH